MSELIHRRSKSFTALIWVFVLFWIILAGFPFLWTMWGSFKVQGDFFSKADWAYAISGLRTQIETGSSFTGDGYHGAWITKSFWQAALNTMIVVVSVVIISLRKVGNVCDSLHDIAMAMTMTMRWHRQCPWPARWGRHARFYYSVPSRW